MEKKNPSIAELIGFLYAYDAHKIKMLQAKYPSYTKIFERGIQLGSQSQEEDIEELRVRSESCLVSLNAIIKKCEEESPKLKKKLVSLNRLQFVTQIIVASSSTSLMSTLQSEGLVFFKYVATFLTFVGSILNIWFQNNSHSLLPDSNSFFKNYDILIDSNINAQKIVQELSILNKFSLDSESEQDEVKRLISKGNEIAFEIQKCLAKIG